MHTFTKLPVIRPIKIQMHVSKYGTKSPYQTKYVKLVFTPKLLMKLQETGELWESLFLEDPLIYKL